MKRTIQLLTIAAGLALGASSASADVTIYRQTFTTASGTGANNYSPTNWNWVSYVGTSSYCTQQNNGFNSSWPSVYVNDIGGYPNNLYNTNATANAGISSPNPAYGYANFRPGSGNASVLFLSATAPGELNASGGIDRSQSVTLDWYWAASATSGNSPGIEFRLAVNVGGTWYVTTNTWVPTTASSGSTFGNGTGVGHAAYTQNNNATNAWLVLPVNVGTSFTTPSGSAAALPAGAITQVGLYFNAGSSTSGAKGYWDNFSISQQPQAVASATTTSLASSLNPSTAGASVTFTATVQVNGVTAANATSNVVFTVDGTLVATNAVAVGQAAYTTSALTVGSHPISAQYRGDANYLVSTGAVTQVVNPFAPPPPPGTLLVYEPFDYPGTAYQTIDGLGTNNETGSFGFGASTWAITGQGGGLKQAKVYPGAINFGDYDGGPHDSHCLQFNNNQNGTVSGQPYVEMYAERTLSDLPVIPAHTTIYMSYLVQHNIDSYTSSQGAYWALSEGVKFNQSSGGYWGDTSYLESYTCTFSGGNPALPAVGMVGSQNFDTSIIQANTAYLVICKFTNLNDPDSGVQVATMWVLSLADYNAIKTAIGSGPLTEAALDAHNTGKKQNANSDVFLDNTYKVKFVAGNAYGYPSVPLFDEFKIFTDLNSWLLTSNIIPRPTLSLAQHGPSMDISWTSSAVFRLQYSDDLAAWTDDATDPVVVSGTTYTATVLKDQAHRFYRVVNP